MNYVTATITLTVLLFVAIVVAIFSTAAAFAYYHKLHHLKEGYQSIQAAN